MPVLLPGKSGPGRQYAKELQRVRPVEVSPSVAPAPTWFRIRYRWHWTVVAAQ